MAGSPALATAAQRLSARFLGAAAAEARRPVFRGANLEVQTSTDREIVIGGPAGTGKSVACLHRLHTIAEQWPGSRQLILRKTRASLTESGLVTLEEKVLPPDHPVLFGGRGQRIERKNRSSYDYPNRSTIVVGGMDEPTRIFSAEYDTVYWQEATEGKQPEWESLHRALRNGVTPHPILMGDCNPQAPSHWVKQRAKAGLLRLLEGRHSDNPRYWSLEANDWTPAGRDYIEENLGRMTGVLRDRLLLGLWVSAEGAIFTMFRPDTHVVPRFAPPGTWRVILSIDFGFTHPLAAQVWLVDGDGRMVLESEMHMAGRTLDEHAPSILAMLRGRPYEGVADSSAPESIERLRALGIRCVPAAKGPDSVRASIRACIARMADPGDGKPRLTIMEGALVERDEARAAKHRPLCLADEMELYRWKVGLGGVVLEEPVKEDDDAVDAMRYAVAYVDGKADTGGTVGVGLVRPARPRLGAF